jgi:hypothetical protein
MFHLFAGSIVLNTIRFSYLVGKACLRAGAQAGVVLDILGD